MVSHGMYEMIERTGTRKERRHIPLAPGDWCPRSTLDLSRMPTRIALLTIRTILLVVLACLPSVSHAQSDLSVDVQVDPADIRPPGTVGTVTVNLSNLGPEEILGPLVTVRVENSGLLPVDFFPITGEPCSLALAILDPFNPGDPVIYVYFFAFPDLQPGDMSSCQATFVVNEQSVGQVPLTWESRRSISQPVDPISANNTATIVFGRPLPTAVPAIRPVAVMLLIFLVGAVAKRRLNLLRKGKPL